jgi:cell division protein FtsW
VSATAAAARSRPPGDRDRARRPAAPRRSPAPPLEHRILMTATLCLLAFGAVMVYSASSPSDLLGRHGGSGASTFVHYVVFCVIGLVGMQVVARRGMSLLQPSRVKLLLGGAYALLVLVLVPGFGVTIGGARRWFAAGPVQFQPSELMKLGLVLYFARFLADNPRRIGSFKLVFAPVAIVAGPALLLVVKEPDMGTTIVMFIALVAMLIAAGVPARHVAVAVGLVLAVGTLYALGSSYQRARLTSFLHPQALATGAGYQAVQGQIALGSGGMFGVGLGRSVQKVFWLPEAQTDFILAVIGEELGVMGIFIVVSLYGMIAYAGLRTARRAAGRYAKLLATGLTSLILCQGILNIFVVLGLAPLTGVPLPFISYAPTNLWVMLGAVGVLLNIASPAQPRLRIIDRRERAADRDRRRRDGRPRRASAGGGGRPAG